MVGVEEGREFRFRGDLYSQESTFPLVQYSNFCACYIDSPLAALYFWFVDEICCRNY